MDLLTDHWPRFVHFVKAETAVHGPDCQLELLLKLIPENASPISKVWLCGAYGAHHCVPPAYSVWQTFAPEAVIDQFESGELEDWLTSHWNSLPVRPEMRSHRMVEKRARCLRDFALYAVQESWADKTQTPDYDSLWFDSQSKVKYYGRYMAIKYLELLRRTVRPDIVLTDVRAKDAWSPRITLGMLWPEHNHIVADREDNSDEAIALAEQCAADTLRVLSEHGVTISYFQLQVLLCNYREMLAGGFYPGAGHDEEMDYMDRARDFQGVVKHIYDVRQRIFPHQYLGELNDWHGLRKEQFQLWKNHPDFVSA